MPSKELLACMTSGASAAETVGLTRGVLDLDGYRSVMASTTFALPRECQVSDVSAGGVPAKWIRTTGEDERGRVLYLHGGGFVAGGWQSHLGIAAWISQSSACSVLLPEYRLAPEHPFPRGLQDAIAAWKWMSGEPVAQASDRPRNVIAGDSAGAGLAMAVILSLIAANSDVPVAGVLLSPFLNLDPTSSKRMQESGFERGLSRAYLGEHNPRDPMASPMFAELVGFPPLLIQVGDADPLAHDGMEFAAKAQAAGVDVTLEVSAGLPHVWHKFGPEVPEARESLVAVGRYIRAKCDQSPTFV